MQKSLDSIQKAVLDTVMISPEEWESNRRSRISKYVQVKVLVCALAHLNGYTTTAIGQYLGITHATVIHHINTFVVQRKFDKVINSIYTRVKLKLKQLNMRILRPSFSVISDFDREKTLKLIESAGRTCYRSEDRIDENSAGPFVSRIVNSGHLSVIEHVSVSVRIVCDRGVSHELVRHRLASYSQESTRYCNYAKKEFDDAGTGVSSTGVGFIEPFWLTSEDREAWYSAMSYAEGTYLALLQKGWTPQQARSVLPNSTATEIVITANLREWKTIFQQRCSHRAHPQMREVMIPIRDHFAGILPEVFADLLPPTEEHSPSSR